MTALKTWGEKWICVRSNLSRLFEPAQIVKCRPAISPGVEFLRTLSGFKKGKENLSSYVHFLHKTSHYEVSHRCAVNVKEIYWKSWYTCRAVVLFHGFFPHLTGTSKQKFVMPDRKSVLKLVKMPSLLMICWKLTKKYSCSCGKSPNFTGACTVGGTFVPPNHTNFY